MGMERETQEEWISAIKEQLKDFYACVTEDAVLLEEKLTSKIEKLLIESERLCKLLQTKMPQYGSKNLSFYEEHKLLKKHVEELQNIVSARTRELELLKSRELSLCKNLGVEVKPIKDSPLPNESELEDINDYIKSLELEIFKREERYMHIKCKIMDLGAHLEIKPSLDLERIVLSDDTHFQVSDENMKWVQNYYVSLQQQYDDMKDDIESLREKVGSLWTMLSEDIQLCNEFIEKHSGCTYSVLKAWKAEFKRCDELKKANIQKFIERLRNQLCDLWEKCHMTNSEREEFVYYRCMIYTEDLLSFHDIEIQKLEKYYNDNRETFSLLERWQESWNKIVQLEEKASAPGRFKNRGGTLLQEEKERNALQKRIPKFEERLIELANNYKMRTGHNFLSWGEKIEDLISKAHNDYKIEKDIKLSARKQQKGLTPGGSTLCLTSAVSGSRLRLDMITPKSASKRPPRTALFSGSNKKPKVTPNKLAVPLIQINEQVVKRRSRTSMERQKCLRKIRNIATGIKKREEMKLNTTFVDYDIFTGELQGDHRSTCVFENTSKPTQAPSN
nr:protein regulator of cytokinesis 1-like [Onthophagus taurus]